MTGLNRRSLLTGLGGLAVGGGALFGSGAFTSVDATRSLEVNVITKNQISDSAMYADVVLQTLDEFETVAVRESDGTLNTDGTGLYPTAAPIDSGNPNSVSLLENDVTIVFGYQDGGTEQQLPPNAGVTYANLIALVDTRSSATDPTDGEHTLSFDNSGFAETTTVSFPNGGPSNAQIAPNSFEAYDVTVSTDNSDDSATAALRITIE